MSRSSSRFITLFALGIAVIGCTTMTPHENFKDHLAIWVGYDADKLRKSRSRDHLSIASLDNGDIEYRYIHYYVRNKPCTEIFIVDPATGIIKSVDSEGGERACVIAP